LHSSESGKNQLLRQKIAPYSDMIIREFAAASRSGGYVMLNIASNTQSSSLLELGTHKELFHDISYKERVGVPLVAVDDWIDEHGLERKLFNMINIDIQVYELEALQGLGKQLPYVDIAYLEVNTQELYKGCARLGEIDALLARYQLLRVATLMGRGGWGDAVYCKSAIARHRLFFAFYYAIVGLLAQIRRVKNAALRIIGCRPQ
jgi:FkbM family methyltransferase